MLRAALLSTLFCLSSLAGAALTEDLQNCAAIKQDGDRLDCYDKLARQDAESQSDASDSRQLTDDVGRKKTVKEIEEESYDVVVAECEKINSRVYFTLENGQIWRQSNSTWMSLRNCGGTGTIHRDYWGYKLTIDAMDDTFRVTRAK